MIAKQIHALLKEIAEKTYPRADIKPFEIEIQTKESRTRHGDYSPRERKIRIFNLSRDTKYIVSTSIHEIAHHCEYCLYGDTGHSKRFYQTLRELLETSVKMGVVSYAEIRQVADAGDIRSLERHFGGVDAEYDPEMDKKKGALAIKISNAFSVKDELKSRGYRYSSIEQAWVKEGPEADIRREEAELRLLVGAGFVSVFPANRMQIEAVYYVSVSNAFSRRDALKGAGYIFNGYGKKGNVWVKKIKAGGLKEEESLLRKFPEISYKVKGID